MKILKNGKTGRHRVLMRREQVLKICANHLITSEMKLAPMADKPAWIWHAMDASPEEANEGQFQITLYPNIFSSGQGFKFAVRSRAVKDARYHLNDIRKYWCFRKHFVAFQNKHEEHLILFQAKL